MNPTGENSEFEQNAQALIATYLQELQEGRAPPPQLWLEQHQEHRPILESLLRERGLLPEEISTDEYFSPTHTQSEDSLLLPLTFVPIEETGKTIAFGNFELTAILGQGGMGIVYKAFHTQSKRFVALKMLRQLQIDSKEMARFQNEIEIISQLDHPSIVPIYEVNRHEGWMYFTMKLLEGGCLLHYEEEIRYSWKKIAELMVKVADAIHYAHCRGVLHRDLNPSNILLDHEGHPYVTDFGLARRLIDCSVLTGSNELIGTPSYMSPEQAQGMNALTVASDVHGLGATLYWLLLGVPPFEGGSPLRIIRQVVEHVPLAPRMLRQEIPLDLELICLQALRKAPQDRYVSAEVFKEDLERFLQGEAIIARPLTFWNRAWYWTRRHPGIVSWMITVFLMFLVILFLLVTHNETLKSVNNELRSSLIRAQQAEIQAEQQRDEIRQRLYVSQMKVVSQALEDQDLGRALSILQRYGPESPRHELCGIEWNLLRAKLIAAISEELRSLWPWPMIGRSELLLFPPGFIENMNQVGSSTQIVVAQQHGLFLCDIRSATIVQILSTEDHRTALLASGRQGQSLIVGFPDGTIHFWSFIGQELQLVRKLTTNKPLQHVVLSQNGDWLALIPKMPMDSVQLLDARNGEVRIRLKQPGSNVAEFSPDGRKLALNSHNDILIVDLQTKAIVSRLQGHLADVTALTFNGSNQRLASIGSDHTLRVWDVPTAKETYSGSIHRMSAASVLFTVDHRSLIIGTEDGEILLWHVKTQQEICRIQKWQVGIRKLISLPKSREVLMLLDNGTVGRLIPTREKMAP